MYAALKNSQKSSSCERCKGIEEVVIIFSKYWWFDHIFSQNLSKWSDISNKIIEHGRNCSFISKSKTDDQAFVMLLK